MATVSADAELRMGLGAFDDDGDARVDEEEEEERGGVGGVDDRAEDEEEKRRGNTDPDEDLFSFTSESTDLDVESRGRLWATVEESRGEGGAFAFFLELKSSSKLSSTY